MFASLPIDVGVENTELVGTGECIDFELEAYIGSLPTVNYVLNPALQLASRFGILPSALPGLIIFRNLPDDNIADACFIATPEGALTTGNAERFLAVLFSELITALHHAARDDFESVIELVTRYVSQGCRVSRARHP